MAVRLSIRLRLTLWNASVLALLLTVFAMGGWITLALALRERADDTVIETARAVAGAVIAERDAARAQGGIAPGGMAARNALRELRAGDLDIVISDDDARVVAASRRARVPGRGRSRTHLAQPEADTNQLAPQVRALMRAATTGNPPLLRTLQLEDGARRAAAVRLEPGNDKTEPALIVAVLRSVYEDDMLLARARTILLLAIPVALGVSVIAGYALARRSLAPVEAMAQQASRISAANLEARLPVVNAHDELGRLATVVNDLLARVDDAFRRQRLFVAEASHELRTPIAIVRGEADVTLQRSAREESEYRESLAVIRDETTRLTGIVNDLFLLASADAGAPLTAHELVDLDELTQGALRSLRSIADERDISLVASNSNDASPPMVSGDRTLLRRLVLNLVDNALKHAPAGGCVELRITTDHGRAVLVVQDDGPGVPPELRDRVFDRFVRGSHERLLMRDDASNGSGASVSNGAGLGLAIAKAIASVHRGTLSLDDTPSGATFRLILPLA